MAYATLSVVPERGGSRTNKRRGTSTDFVDGYSQEVTAGLHKTIAEVPFSFSGSYDDCKAVEDFFLANTTSPFYFRFMPQEPLRLYRLTGDFTLTHDGGLRWNIAASFRQYIGF